MDKEAIKQRLFAQRKINTDTGCWEWTGGRVKKRYGCMRVNVRKCLVHRVSAYVFKNFQYLTDERYCLHKCDNPPCFNPDHLFFGDQFDNMQDSIRKGRLHRAKGTKNGNSKLNPDKVLKIRKLLKEGLSQTKVAKMMNVEQTNISNIHLGKTWSHVT